MPNQKLVGDFVALPESTLDSKQWKTFTASARCVYTTMLRKYMRKGDNANGRVRWKQEEIASEGGLSINTVKRGLDDLKEAGWVKVWEPGGRWLDGTTYEIDPEWANGKEGKE